MKELSPRKRVREMSEAMSAGSTVFDSFAAVLEALLNLHQCSPNTASALYPAPLCSCGQQYPCATRQVLDRAPELSGERWFAASWRSDDGELTSQPFPPSMNREQVEAEAERWRAMERGCSDGRPDCVVVVTKIRHPWVAVEGSGL